MKVAEFLIVGGMKCGTSSLRDFLMQHPKIAMLKAEGDFFNVEEHYNQGADYYRNRFFGIDSAEEKMWGEKTVDYSYFSEIAERVYSYNPKIKLIWILRNPVTRTYSNYLHEYKRGEELLSFKDALEREINGDVKNRFHYYLKRSTYSVQITNYLKYFPKEQIFFVLFEDLIQENTSIMADLGKFLHVDFTGLIYKPTNITKIPRFPKLVKFANTKLKNNLIARKLIAVVNTRFKQEGYTPIKEEHNKWLKNYFKEEIVTLKELVPLNLEKWSN